MTFTDAQLDAAVAFIARTVAEQGYPPTVREIGKAIGYKSSETAQRLVVQLETTGRIRRGLDRRRLIMIHAKEN